MSTIIGAILGFFLGGPFGAVIGGFLGSWFGKKLRYLKSENSSSENQEQVQSVFFKATFLVMGCVAKSDGRVSQDEIHAAMDLMNSMRLSESQRQKAMEFFNLGKTSSDEEINRAILEFVQIANSQKLIIMFLEIQLQAAYADGAITNNERVILQRVCQLLGISQFKFEIIHARFQAQRGYYQNHSSSSGYSSRTSHKELEEAYKVLGVSASATDVEVKKAYKKLMSQHHPDKLVAQGLPEEMMTVAKQKTQQIQGAYDHVRKSRL